MGRKQRDRTRPAADVAETADESYAPSTRLYNLAQDPQDSSASRLERKLYERELIRQQEELVKT